MLREPERSGIPVCRVLVPLFKLPLKRACGSVGNANRLVVGILARIGLGDTEELIRRVNLLDGRAFDFDWSQPRIQERPDEAQELPAVRALTVVKADIRFRLLEVLREVRPPVVPLAR